jgi:hypothetical protein
VFRVTPASTDTSPSSAPSGRWTTCPPRQVAPIALAVLDMPLTYSQPYNFDFQLMKKISTRIVNEVEGIARVTVSHFSRLLYEESRDVGCGPAQTPEPNVFIPPSHVNQHRRSLSTPNPGPRLCLVSTFCALEAHANIAGRTMTRRSTHQNIWEERETTNTDFLSTILLRNPPEQSKWSKRRNCRAIMAMEGKGSSDVNCRALGWVDGWLDFIEWPPIDQKNPLGKTCIQ